MIIIISLLLINNKIWHSFDLPSFQSPSVYCRLDVDEECEDQDDEVESEFYLVPNVEDAYYHNIIIGYY